jgi:hypothetical protein
MADAVEAALIAGSASITVGLIAAYANARQAERTRGLQLELAKRQQAFETRLEEVKSELERQAKAEEKELDAQEALALFREPLRYAAEDLRHRINNLRAGDFMAYVDQENRRQEIAVLGTAYRFARFFATLEMLYDRAEFMRLERQTSGDSDERSVVETLAEIGSTFADDEHDRADEDDFLSSRFMIWREEQRAMGELAREREQGRVVGFATFAARATGPDAKWFENLIEDLTAGGAPESDRLELIESLLARLVRLLDPKDAAGGG